MSASAPAKAFVTGEYAVAAGRPAVVAALDLRLRCRARLVPGRGRLRLARRGDRADVGLRRARAEDLPEGLRFAGIAALAAARTLGLDRRDRCDLEVETDEIQPQGSAKLGLGGSAATTAAVIGAVWLASGRALGAADLVRRVALGLEAHRLAQGGGSGADVVAATVGGVLCIETGSADRPLPSLEACRGQSRPRFRRLVLPRGLELALVATRRPAASQPRVARFLGALRSRAGGAAAETLAAWCEGMSAASREVVAGCAEESAERVMAGVRLASGLLLRLGGIAGIPISTPELRRAIAAATPGAAIKPSGAGGGDCAVALVARSERPALERAWRGAGLEPLALAVDPEGVRPEAGLG